MVIQSLAQLTQHIDEQYGNLRSYVIPSQQISMTEAGLLDTGEDQFPVALEGLDQFARSANIPTLFFRTLESDLQALVFNRRFQAEVAHGSIGRDIRINLNKESQIIGYDDPRLLRIIPPKLMQVVNSSLPEGLSTERISISRMQATTNILSFSCFSPEIITKARVGDIVNGGIDVHHSISGEFGTQIRCYLRRKICMNGACTHICEDEKHVRARRLRDGRFDEKDMLDQIHRLLTKAWTQIDTKLETIKGLLNKGSVSPNFLQQQRTRFSLSNRVLDEIEVAVNQDEIGPTGTAYDLFNAISRIASHDDSLSLRQVRRLMFMAGEFSQQDVHRCPHCGSWVVCEN